MQTMSGGLVKGKRRQVSKHECVSVSVGVRVWVVVDVHWVLFCVRLRSASWAFNVVLQLPAYLCVVVGCLSLSTLV